ncbi:MAG TPA: EAL domain-containing protein [Bryobacteraceae bacterium]|jgi:EAL domain-containing protein (putative c-di-GMP-specific phosphodiesterase class I)|nr:EAL domain-containing protein [Bryobacteraceae bacterium]
MPYEISTGRDLKADWFQNALAENRFETWFQPVIDTSGHRILGHECLIRLRDEQSGEGETFRSGERIMAAARAGNHLPLFDSRAMALAVRAAAGQSRSVEDRGIPESGGGKDRGVFFVNMLPGSMLEPQKSMRLAMEALAAAQQTSGVRAENFVFEMVDSDLTGDSSRVRVAHDYIRRQGCGFALDNTGLGLGKRQGEMGSTTFEMIRDLRPDYIKIDQQLVWNIEQPVCASTVRKLVELSDRYGAKVIAVGVERHRMVENLWLLGVQVMQGYLFGRPSPGIARSGPQAECRMGCISSNDLANLALALVPERRGSDLNTDLEVTADTSWHRHETPLFADLN